MDSIFKTCPSCGSNFMRYDSYNIRAQEHCLECGFTTTWVEFTCNCCNPDIFGICPRKNCANRGTPTKRLCIPQKI